MGLLIVECVAFLRADQSRVLAWRLSLLFPFTLLLLTGQLVVVGRKLRCSLPTSRQGPAINFQFGVHLL